MLGGFTDPGEAGGRHDMSESLLVELADAPNPAMTLQLHIGSHWRGVGDPVRWAAAS